MTLRLKFLLFMPNWKFLISQKSHSDATDFQLQYIRLCETVGKGVFIKRTGANRNCSLYIIIHASLALVI